PDSIKSAWDYPNLLAQKFPTEEFTATAKISFQPKHEKERFGLMVHGASYAYIAVEKRADGNHISFVKAVDADRKGKETVQDGEKLKSKDIYLRVQVRKNAVCTFSYSEDGTNFKTIGESLTAKPGRWVGAKVGFFFNRSNKTNDAGVTDVDWFRVSGQ
ncbi:MAG TPA: hypothetical protein VL946_06000, partial [Lacibacter sp.]|nr:hypothetical protein [Lacibacter sp.]